MGYPSSDVIKEMGSRGHLYLLERGEILRPNNDNQMRKRLSRMYQLIKNESWGIEDD